MQHIFFTTDRTMEKTIKHYTETIYYEMELTGKVMKMLAVQFFNKLNRDLMPDEYVALDVIACNENICQRDLAKLVLKDRATTGRIVESLEKKGLISRSVDTKNNRLVRNLSVTKDGYKAIDEITGEIKKRFKEIGNIISEIEIEKLKEGLRAFRTSLGTFIESKI